MRTARYRVVLPKLIVDGRLKEKKGRRRRRRRREVLPFPVPSSPTRGRGPGPQGDFSPVRGDGTSPHAIVQEVIAVSWHRIMPVSF
ncbi:hypothetical protein BHE74_00058004 [Ensete ventricosum]|nr:hypothetical protein BHE74_00058004 [Ensete ventricosum]RZS28549.1 hypothetical protein BHM03_00062205 [Ensete ventricosum]